MISSISFDRLPHPALLVLLGLRKQVVEVGAIVEDRPVVLHVLRRVLPERASLLLCEYWFRPGQKNTPRRVEQFSPWWPSHTAAQEQFHKFNILYCDAVVLFGGFFYRLTTLPHSSCLPLLNCKKWTWTCECVSPAKPYEVLNSLITCVAALFTNSSCLGIVKSIIISKRIVV